MSDDAKNDEIVGHKTMFDGTHVPLTASEAKGIWEMVEASNMRRRALMPDSMAAIGILLDALTRLRDEGWSEGIYCPKDGSEFAVIQYGSTGIFEAFYSGEWPTGHVISCDFVSSPNGMLWKALAKLSPAEKSKLDECMAAEKIMHEREIQAFAAMDGNESA